MNKNHTPNIEKVNDHIDNLILLYGNCSNAKNAKRELQLALTELTGVVLYTPPPPLKIKLGGNYQLQGQAVIWTIIQLPHDSSFQLIDWLRGDYGYPGKTFKTLEELEKHMNKGAEYTGNPEWKEVKLGTSVDKISESKTI